LCRYVKERSSAPVSEHELLLEHVVSLSRRGGGYVQERWGLTDDQLLQAATKIARLFAMDASLGLSPTFVEIVSSCASTGESTDADLLMRELDALCYVKIGRTDVQSTDPRVRRFAFGHRRYQECLFAKLLIDDPNTIPYTDLIADTRWREYVVAVLQIGKHEVADRVIDATTRFLSKLVVRLKYRSRRYAGVVISSYHWNDDELKHVLSILQEGLKYRQVSEIGSVDAVVNSIASPLWDRGDSYDRLIILRYCSAVRSELLSKRVESATSSGIVALEEAAVYACRYVSVPSNVSVRRSHLDSLRQFD
jgi:hypothetical protein